jgi:hypothetical protein
VARNHQEPQYSGPVRPGNSYTPDLKIQGKEEVNDNDEFLKLNFEKGNQI